MSKEEIGTLGDSQRTKVDVKGGQHPMWDEELRVPILRDSHEKHRKLEVSCWAKEPRKESNLGTGFIDLAETLKTGEFDDWVPLEYNGSTRGEVYLEMTFYSNGPAPAPTTSGLSVPKSNFLQRRPSKLSPSERLARPSSNHESLPLVVSKHDHEDHAPSTYAGSPAHPGRSPPRTGRNSPLPPLPEQTAGLPLPSTLMPGKPHTAAGTPVSLTPHVPSILRPRNPKSSPTPIPGPATEYHGVVPAQSGTPSRTYTPVVPAPDDAYRPGTSPPGPKLDIWSPESGPTNPPGPAGFSFPVPTVQGGRQPSVEYSSPSPPIPGGYPSHQRQPSVPYQQQQQPTSQQSNPIPAQTPSYQTPPPAHFQPQQQPSYFPPASPYQQGLSTQFRGPSPSFQPQPRSELPDPYLSARYQSPLPLPPGAEASTQKSAPAPQHDPDNARVQAMKQAEEEAARKKSAAQEAERLRAETLRKEEELAMKREAEAEAVRKRELEEEEEKARRREIEAEKTRREEAERKKQREMDEARLKALREAEERAARRKEQEDRERAVDEARLQALKEAEERAAKRREQEERDRALARQLDLEFSTEPPRLAPEPVQDNARTRALRRAEEEEKRRRDQEEKDMELARQLDRELNLGISGQ
ncbi:unnamed protein product [Mycena citricolor]|uniref:C2 domain-containing protein n=1 Tax=Mycena citricolor TaxID=2018698 RepID=A0AAD2JYB1_9AGAR|nr:unnamed protein product [Mycena citricolor]